MQTTIDRSLLNSSNNFVLTRLLWLREQKHHTSKWPVCVHSKFLPQSDSPAYHIVMKMSPRHCPTPFSYIKFPFKVEHSIIILINIYIYVFCPRELRALPWFVAFTSDPFSAILLCINKITIPGPCSLFGIHLSICVFAFSGQIMALVEGTTTNR